MCPWIVSLYTIFQTSLAPIKRAVMVLHYFSHAARSHFSPKPSNDVILTPSWVLAQPPPPHLNPLFINPPKLLPLNIRAEENNKALKTCGEMQIPPNTQLDAELTH